MPQPDLSEFLSQVTDFSPGASPLTPIQEQHPDAGKVRLLINNLSPSVRASQELLANEGFIAVPIAGDNFAIRKKGEQEWRVLDPAHLDLGDVTDLGDEAASVLATGAGFAAGGPLGAGAANAATSGLRSTLAAAAGLTPTAGEAATDALLAGALGAAPIVGNIAREGPRTALKQATKTLTSGAEDLVARGRDALSGLPGAAAMGERLGGTRVGSAVARARRLEQRPFHEVFEEGTRRGRIPEELRFDSTFRKQDDLLALLRGRPITERGSKALDRAVAKKRLKEPAADKPESLRRAVAGAADDLRKKFPKAGEAAVALGGAAVRVAKSLPTARGVTLVARAAMGSTRPLRSLLGVGSLTAGQRAQISRTINLFRNDPQAYRAALFVLLSQPALRRIISKELEENG